MLTDRMEENVWEMVSESLKFPFSMVLVRPLHFFLKRFVRVSIPFLYIMGQTVKKFWGGCMQGFVYTFLL